MKHIVARKKYLCGQFKDPSTQNRPKTYGIELCKLHSAVIFWLCLCHYLIYIILLLNHMLKQRRQHVQINDSISGRSSFLANSPSVLSVAVSCVPLIMLCGNSTRLVISTRCSKTWRPCGKRRSQRTVPVAYTSSKQQPITSSQYYFQRHTLKNKLSN